MVLGVELEVDAVTDFGGDLIGSENRLKGDRCQEYGLATTLSNTRTAELPSLSFPTITVMSAALTNEAVARTTAATENFIVKD